MRLALSESSQDDSGICSTRRQVWYSLFVNARRGKKESDREEAPLYDKGVVRWIEAWLRKSLWLLSKGVARPVIDKRKGVWLENPDDCPEPRARSESLRPTGTVRTHPSARPPPDANGDSTALGKLVGLAEDMCY